MAHEASGNLARGTTPSTAWIYLLEDGNDWWMSKLFIRGSRTGRSISWTRGLLKGQRSAGPGRVHSSLTKPQYLPNSYLLKRLKRKINVVWKTERVLSEVFSRFPAENIICRISKMIELNGQYHGGENDLWKKIRCCNARLLQSSELFASMLSDDLSCLYFL